MIRKTMAAKTPAIPRIFRNTILRRTDPSRNMYRRYAVWIQPSLFDPCAVLCFWGSTRNAYSRQRVIPAANYEEAVQLAEKIVALKVKRGYHV